MSSTTINVEKENEREFAVTVEERYGISKYRVTLDDDYYAQLTAGKISKEKLIEISFEFLLARESSRSIFPEFDLRVIKEYFPEYEKEVEKKPWH